MGTMIMYIELYKSDFRGPRKGVSCSKHSRLHFLLEILVRRKRHRNLLKYRRVSPISGMLKKSDEKKAQPVARVIGSICFDILRAYTHDRYPKRNANRRNRTGNSVVAAALLMSLGRWESHSIKRVVSSRSRRQKGSRKKTVIYRGPPTVFWK